MAFIYGNLGTVKEGGGQSGSPEYEVRLGYQVNSQSIENNTSNITLRLEVRSTDSDYATRGYNQTSKIDGVNLSAKTFDMSDTNVWQIFGTRTITVQHNNDGSYSVTKSASFTTTATGTYSLKSGSASVTVSPPTIARASQPSLPAGVTSINLGDSIVISTNRVSSTFTHTLRYSFGNISENIATGVTNNATFTPRLNLANQIPNNDNGICTISCDTYNGSTFIGTKTVTLKLIVPNNIKPTINNVAISENGVVPTSWGAFVQSKSSLRIITTAIGAYNSTISNCKITGLDSNIYTGTTVNTNVLTFFGNKTFTITVTDSRGRTTTRTETINVAKYESPIITNFNVHRCRANGTLDEEGEYCKAELIGTISSVNNKNTKSWQISHKQTNDYSYISDFTGSEYVVNTTQIIPGVSGNLTYLIKATLSDYFTSSSKEEPLATATNLLNFNQSGKGLGIGKVSEKDALEIALDTEITGNLINEIKSSGQSFNRGSWGVPTKGLITQVTDNSNAQHSVIVGLASNGTTRLYGMDLLDSDNNPAMKISVKSNSLKIEEGETTSTKGLTISDGLLKINKSGHTLTMGSQNTYYSHIYTTAPSFYFNKNIIVNGYYAALEKYMSIVANEGNTQSYINIGSLLICFGNVNITPTSANTPKAQAITFSKAFKVKPFLFTTPYSAVPGSQVTGTGASNITTAGCSIYLTRTNTTTTSVMWLAIGEIA